MRRLLTLAATLTAVAVPVATEMPARAEATSPQVGGPQQSTAQQRDAVSITVYNQNFGLVREMRTLDLPSGRVDLKYGDVASGIQPETVHIRPVGGRGLTILEQNYQFDLLNPQKLLEKYVGRMVNVYRTNPQPGEEQALEAEVLSVNGGTNLRIGDEITFNYPGRFGFPEVPDNLIAAPTLLWRMDAGGGDQQVEVSYLTQSMNWKSDYVMVLNEDDDEAGLMGWVMLTNQSGTSFEGARLQLVAGDVQRVANNMAPAAMRRAMMADVAQESAGFSEQGFFEYHLYTLNRPADLLNNEQKQVTLLEAEEFGVRKRLIFSGAQHYYRGQYGQVTSNEKVGVFLDFENSDRNGLGMPLPKGIVRVYKRDDSGAQQFIGEDLIDHTPRNETVRIKMGEAFDVVGDRIQMDYDVISSCVSESTWRIDLRNHKEEDVDVTLVEPVGGDWQIISSTHPYTRMDAWTFSMSPEVPADGETRVEYRVRVRWC
jgi:hypothetical protein